MFWNKLTGRWQAMQAALRCYYGQPRKPGWQAHAGRSAAILRCHRNWKLRIAAALGEYLDAVLVDNQGASDAALDLLAGEMARGALLPMDTLAPPSVLNKIEFEGVIGIAADLVHASPAFRPALDLLLGQTIVVHDRAAARRILAKLDTRESGIRAVTTKGEVFYGNGAVMAGQEGGPTTLSRPRQRKDLGSELDRNRKKREELEGRLQETEGEVKNRQDDVQKLQQMDIASRTAEEKAQQVYSHAAAAAEQSARQRRWQEEQYLRLRKDVELGDTKSQTMQDELERVNAEIAHSREGLRSLNNALAELSLDEYQAQVGHWNTRAAVSERAVTDSLARLAEREAALIGAQKTLVTTQARLEELVVLYSQMEENKLAQRQAELEVTTQIEALRLLIDPAEAELDRFELDQASAQESEAISRQAVSKAEHHHAQARITLARRQEALETWRRRIEDDFGLVAFEYEEDISGPTPLPLDGMVEQLPRVTQISTDLEENLRRQRAQLRRMGPINPEAQAEHREVKERHEFMTVQVADLNRAEEDVRQVIAELDALMQKELRKTFDAVAEEFTAIFKRLFGGGTARLVLTDPDDMTNTGIDIEARLPGRRMQGLSLLSGGERSLTASSLVFALLKVSPTPFCLLDEVDAMLDEANVGRFRELLRELSQVTQFIVVTHNRNTVQAADVIYGVTMGRDSASQVISLKLDEVDKVVED